MSAANAAALRPLSWLGIVRLGLVQTALGAIVVLTTSTMNRVMVVELALPALLPGILVAIHYAIQVLRPRLGHGSDVGGRRTPWIVGGMATLSLGGVLASVAIAWMQSALVAGIVLAVLAFVMIGVGVGAAGTSLLVLLAVRTAPERRSAAATLVWVMMILGFIVTAGAVGALLDPFTPLRLVLITSAVAAIALAITLAAVWGMEGKPPAAKDPAASEAADAPRPSFLQALREVWQEPQARAFTLFIFVSMLAYSAQDLILEPFAGIVFGYTPGQTTQLSGTQNAGVLAGMVLVGFAGRRFGTMRGWTIVGCIASALALASLTLAALAGPGWPLQASVFGLGFANGTFAVAAIGSMMTLVGQGRAAREGVRMGLWGAAQAIAFGLGGLAGAAASDLARWLVGAPGPAYAAVFGLEAALFAIAAVMAARLGRTRRVTMERAPQLQVAGAE
jgi:BCD family chlorophyll transporter-like MFS transporter